MRPSGPLDRKAGQLGSRNKEQGNKLVNPRRGKRKEKEKRGIQRCHYQLPTRSVAPGWWHAFNVGTFHEKHPSGTHTAIHSSPIEQTQLQSQIDDQVGRGLRQNPVRVRRIVYPRKTINGTSKVEKRLCANPHDQQITQGNEPKDKKMAQPMQLSGSSAETGLRKIDRRWVGTIEIQKAQDLPRYG